MAVRVVYFFQEGCMACQEQEPILKELEKARTIQVERINPLKERSYISQFNLRVTPTILIILDGEEKERFEGMVYREQLEEALARYL